MKERVIALFLCFSLFLCSCSANSNDASNTGSESVEISFSGMSDPDLLPFISDQVYAELDAELSNGDFIIEDVQTIYISKEYLEELSYNSKENVYFGFTFTEIAEQFAGTSYVFTLNENGETTVQEVIAYDDTYDTVIKNIAIGTGVILVCATVAIVTKSPAATAGAGKTVKAIFAISSTAAKGGIVQALKGASLGGAISSMVEATKTNDIHEITKAGLVGASEGFKWGAIFGTVKSTVDGIRIVKNTHYFPDNSAQAVKYPQGVEFSTGTDGRKYPRFERWAINTVKFDLPTQESALAHTGLSGNYWYDSKLANALCGYKQTPAGYVWHHVEDMRTMLLIPQDLHNVSFGGMPHVGGASMIEAFLSAA